MEVARIRDQAYEFCPFHLIDEKGILDVARIEAFVKEVKLAECGLSYAIVSIMGPQSSGKSTLLNHLFGTNFREMDALKERCQTTKGIWLAKCPGIKPCTLVMDLEGTDGRERGEEACRVAKSRWSFTSGLAAGAAVGMAGVTAFGALGGTAAVSSSRFVAQLVMGAVPLFFSYSRRN